MWLKNENGFDKIVKVFGYKSIEFGDWVGYFLIWFGDD